jgi:hypothetical protein
MSDAIANLLKWGTDWLTYLSAFLSALAVAGALGAQLVRLFLDREEPVSSPPVVSLTGVPDWEVDTRLAEARNALRRQHRAARLNRWTANSLTVGQYIIGGLLATSFVQNSLSPSVVGFIGLLVLVSSLIHQRFRPDIKARNAAERAVKLRDLIRRGEDLVFEMKRNGDIAGVQRVRQLVSETLSDIDKAELADLGTLGGSNKV